MRPLPLVGVVVLLAVLLLAVPQAHGAHKSPGVIATIGVGDFPLGVGVNASTKRVYVANFFAATVSVIDGRTNTIIATIPVGSRPRDAAVNRNTNRVYVPNSNSNTVSVIDERTNTVIATIPVGDSPGDVVGVNPVTNRVYVPNVAVDTVSDLAMASSASTHRLLWTNCPRKW